MQLASAQLSKHLQQGLKSLYTVYGDEALLQQEVLDALRAQARSQGYTERSVHTVAGAHFDWGAVLSASGSQSLFADKQVLELRIPSGKPGKDGSTALQQLAASAQGNDSTLLLVSLPRLDKLSKSSAWFEALERFGVTVPVEPIERSALPQWIAQRLAAQGLRVAPGEEGQRTLQFFADRVEGNLLAAHQEIQKLALLYPVTAALAPGHAAPASAATPTTPAAGAGTPGDATAQPGVLRFAQVERAVLNVTRYDVFKLSEAVLAGQMQRVQRMLEGLQAEGEAEVLVHYTLAEDIRALKRVKDAMAQGRPLPMALRENRIWGAKERLFERVLPRLSAATLAELLHAAHLVDGIVKGLKQPDWPSSGWQSLHRLALLLCVRCAGPAQAAARG